MSKLLYFFSSFIFLIILACDNEIAPSQVPSIVENTFKHHFPHAMDIEWEIVDSNYEVSFEVATIDHKALLDSTGTLLKFKYEIDKATVPISIKSFLEQNYPQERWGDPEHIKEGISEYFQLERDGFFNDKKLVIDSMGKELPNIKYWD